MRTIVAAVLFGVILTGPAGCVKSVPDLPTKAPVVIDKIDQTLHAASIKAFGISEALGAVAVDVAIIEKQLFNDKVIPADVHQQIQKGFGLLADRALAFNTAVANGVIKTWADLQVQVNSLLSAVQSVLDMVAGFKQQFGQTLETFRKIGVDILGAILKKAPEPVALEAR
jgi:hypothetical protein